MFGGLLRHSPYPHACFSLRRANQNHHFDYHLQGCQLYSAFVRSNAVEGASCAWKGVAPSSRSVVASGGGGSKTEWMSRNIDSTCTWTWPPPIERRDRLRSLSGSWLGYCCLPQMLSRQCLSPGQSPPQFLRLSENTNFGWCRVLWLGPLFQSLATQWVAPTDWAG